MKKLTLVKISNWLFSLFILSLHFPYPFRFKGAIITPSYLFFMLYVLSYLGVAVKNKRVHIWPFAYNSVKYYALFIIACVVSMSVAPSFSFALKETIQYVFTFFMFVFLLLISSDFYYKLNRKNIFWLILLPLFIHCLVGLFQYLFQKGSFSSRISEYRSRSFSLFGQPNGFGGYLSIMLVFIFSLYNEESPLRWKYLLFISAAFAFLALLTTFSRGSWIALAVGVVFLFLRSRSARRFIIKFLPVATIIIVTVFFDLSFVKYSFSKEPKTPPFPSSTQGSTGTTSVPIVKLILREASNQERIKLAIYAIEMFIKNPIIGVGPGNYQFVLERDYGVKNIEIVHNFMLQIMAENGVVGISLFSLFLIYCLGSSLKMLKIKNDGWLYKARLLFLAVSIAHLVSSLFGWIFTHGLQEWLLISLAAASVPNSVLMKKFKISVANQK